MESVKLNLENLKHSIKFLNNNISKYCEQDIEMNNDTIIKLRNELQTVLFEFNSVHKIIKELLDNTVQIVQSNCNHTWEIDFISCECSTHYECNKCKLYKL